MAFKRKNWGYTTPLLSPLYSSPPHYFTEAKILMAVYEMKEEVLRDLVPEPLEPVGNKCAAYVGMDARIATGLGTYLEGGILPVVKYKDYVGVLLTLLYLDSEVPICAVREIWGAGSKLGKLKLYEQQNIVRGEVERAGRRLMSVSVSLEGPGKPEDAAIYLSGAFAIKVIPSPEEGQPPEVCELVYFESDITKVHGFWKGTGEVAFPERSDLDPVYKFEPSKVIAGYYAIFDFVLPFGKIIHRY
jgi:acetoacetate decarboxylase